MWFSWMMMMTEVWAPGSPPVSPWSQCSPWLQQCRSLWSVLPWGQHNCSCRSPWSRHSPPLYNINMTLITDQHLSPGHVGLSLISSNIVAEGVGHGWTITTIIIGWVGWSRGWSKTKGKLRRPSSKIINHLVVKTLVLVLAGNVAALLLVVTILLLRTLSRLAPDRESLSPSSTSLTLLTSPRTPGLMMLVVRTLPGLLAGMGIWGREAVSPIRRRDGASDDNILIKKI